MSSAVNAVPGMHSDKTMARALALVMHAAFIALLIFGVSWQKKPGSPGGCGFVEQLAAHAAAQSRSYAGAACT